MSKEFGRELRIAPELGYGRSPARESRVEAPQDGSCALPPDETGPEPVRIASAATADRRRAAVLSVACAHDPSRPGTAFPVRETDHADPARRSALKRPDEIRARRRARGVSLIEVLVAMAILALLMIGVLQLFSVSFLTDSGSAARTDMTMRAQQVAENLRYLHLLRARGTALPPGTGLPATPSDGLTTDLPWDGTEPAWSYWGPNGANVFERPRPPYRVSYTYTASTTPDHWFVTVTVTPGAASAGNAYLGTTARARKVDYVFQVRG